MGLWGRAERGWDLGLNVQFLLLRPEPPASTQSLIPGDDGFAGDASFVEKNGSTFRSIRSFTRLVWSPSSSS